jgi:4'-phosphopantetheinyl transferase
MTNDSDCRLCRAFLTDEERAREHLFLFPVDRHLYLLSRALVRTVLSQYLSVAPRDLVFEPNAYGRPQLIGPELGSPKISFNLSHTRGLVVLGVSCDRELGVDVENIERKSPLDIATRFLAPNEMADLNHLSPTAQHERFFEYWTLKEAYIKARSRGLSLSLQQFEFEFRGASEIGFSTQTIPADPPGRWKFWQLWLGCSFLAAVCAEVNSVTTPLIRATRVTPLLNIMEPIEILRTRSTTET